MNIPWQKTRNALGGSYGLPLLIKQKGLNHGIFTLNTLSGPNCFPKEPPLNTIVYLLHHGDYAKVQVHQGHASYGHTSPGMYAFLTQLQRYPFPVCSFKRTLYTQASARRKRDLFKTKWERFLNPVTSLETHSLVPGMVLGTIECQSLSRKLWYP